ncbi:hypothetical protein Molly5_163 [Maribacter phage Molly_5]|uniref:Uncharacterized protein n=2 Tax=Mollyvirus TaxID=2948826 RepID=A0A8E4XZQ6_9CAUD|nr:hypothetical protein M1M29_gp163 [Maribacter phage Molly_1]YP_010357407.1 hypothetical protein M1M30_gp158 [Maribacter phage Colly_1]QQO97659.1 hypothetical protein Molly2_163 [Maribacter phage Molly_2]QQO97859.1 hypothetical protein Molly3_163 [Maribacter phage Molly_3]QQO98059.1 hypothetical protein Molly4_163 [Maribacter phage Molly_4]QQO98259.1 hypothetical protein Molly5_163 [Maribacter phage Molly_5]QQO97260.1 hypothetical protein Colly1_158 [Maribacter phage Colly_1]
MVAKSRADVLRHKLLLAEIEERKEAQEEIKTLVLDKLNTFTNKCYVKRGQSHSHTAYRFLGVKSKLFDQGGSTLLKVYLKLDTVIKLYYPPKGKGKHSVTYNYFQDSPYGELDEQTFTLDYDDPDGVFNFRRSFHNFTMHLTEISEEHYNDLCSVAKTNEQLTEALIDKYPHDYR